MGPFGLVPYATGIIADRIILSAEQLLPVYYASVRSHIFSSTLTGRVTSRIVDKQEVIQEQSGNCKAPRSEDSVLRVRTASPF
jgi:putative effector of murein hydrolase LrgA (UPF0299 family)